jgi:phosphoribosylanthranilate isomerase
MSFVKICGTTSFDDAMIAHRAGADAVGFIFAESSRRVDADLVSAVVRHLPSDLLTVGVFRGASVDEVRATVRRSGVAAVQLHGDESPEFAAAVRDVAPFLIGCFTADDARLARLDDYDLDAVLVDSPAPGSGETFDWSTIDGLSSQRRLVLAGGLDPDNVAAAVERVRPWGVDVVSGVEEERGRKDPRAVERFVEAARSALAEYAIDPGRA